MNVYIAAPYTNGDTAQSIRRVIECADRLCELGHVPFVPHLTHLWHLISPKPYDFWLGYDLAWLNICDALLRLPGESKGADMEVEYAKNHFIPVYYAIEELK